MIGKCNGISSGPSTFCLEDSLPAVHKISVSGHYALRNLGNNKNNEVYLQCYESAPAAAQCELNLVCLVKPCDECLKVCL